MDIYSSVWTEADASNTTAAPDGAPEGMAPSGVNDVLRAHQGAVKRFVVQQGPKLTTGTSTAYVLTYDVAPGALVDAMTHSVEFHTANGAAATLNINALGAKPLHYYSAGAWRTLPPDLFGANRVFRVAYHAGTGAYRLLGREDTTGEISEYAGSTVPKGALLCNGAAVSRATYAGLFAVIGTSHGVGDGSTTFNVPNHTNRFVRGNGTPGTTGGADTHSHTASGATSGSLSFNVNSGGDFGGTIAAGTGGGTAANTGHQHNVTGSTSGSLSVSGSTSVVSNIPAFIAENKIIRT